MEQSRGPGSSCGILGVGHVSPPTAGGSIPRIWQRRLPAWLGILSFPWDEGKDPVLALGGSDRDAGSPEAPSSVSVPVESWERRGCASVSPYSKQGGCSSPTLKQHLARGQACFSQGRGTSVAPPVA